MGQSGHNSLRAGDELSDRRREIAEFGVSIPDADPGLVGQYKPSKSSPVTGVRMMLPSGDVSLDAFAPFTAVFS